ncbi:MAG TPA: DUF748 domain-containing protein [Candidatus Binatia bacterium]|jgi:hypothetical protein
MIAPGRLLARRRNQILLALVVLVIAVRVALPHVIRRVAVSQADAALVGRIELDDVDLALLTGGITLHGLRVFATEAPHDPQPAAAPAAGEGAPGVAPVFSATRLYVQVGYRALFRKLVELRHVELDGFAVSLDRAADGTLVLPAAVPTAAPSAPPAETGPGWGVLIQHVGLRDGRIGFRDFALGDPPQKIEGRLPTLDAGNLALLITEGGVEPGKIALDAAVEDGTLHVDVALERGPGGPVYQSHVVLGNLPITHGRRYIPRVGWSDLSGRLDLDVVHRFESQGAHTLHGTLGLRDLAVRVEGLEQPALAWSALAVEVKEIDLVKQHADVASVTLAGAQIATRPAGPEPLPVLHGLVQAAKEDVAAAAPAPAEKAAPWTWNVGTVSLTDAGVHVLGGDAPVDVGVAATVTGVASAPSTRTTIDVTLSPSSGGTLAVAGDLTIDPLGFDGTLRTDGLVLPALAGPVATPQTRLLKSAVATLDLQVSAGATAKAPPDGVRVAGKLELAKVEVASETPRPFALRWQDLALDVRELAAPGILARDAAAKGAPITVALARLAFDHPEIVATRTDTGIALPAELGPPAAAAPTPAPPPQAPAPTPAVQVRIDDVAVRGMKVAFSDETVKPFYRSTLDPIDLTCSDLAWPGPSAKNVKLTAKGLDGATLTVTGNVAPAGSRVQVALAGLPLAPFNPYATSSGYAVAGGTAKLESKITTGPSSYDTTNKLVLNQLAVTGGEGDALFTSSFGMPLSLALSLMTDLEGNIVLDVPIAGDAKGVRTGLSTLVGNALARAILNAVTSPLKLVGAVAHLGEKPASLAPQPIVFPAGRSDMPASEDAKLSQLASLLGAAPGLKLHLRGEAGDEDRRRLREQLLKAKLERESGVIGTVRHIGERGARGAVLGVLQARAEGKTADVPEEHKAWFEEQVAAQEVPDEQLKTLAAARAANVGARLASSQGVGKDRIVVDDPAVDAKAHPTVTIGLGAPPSSPSPPPGP